MKNQPNHFKVETSGKISKQEYLKLCCIDAFCKFKKLNDHNVQKDCDRVHKREL